MTHPLIRKLLQREQLSEAECKVLLSAASPVREVAADQDIVREGDRPTESTLMIDGFCGRYSTFPDGRRQFTALHIAGDFVDLHSFLLKPMDHGVVALSPCRVVTVPHAALREITEQFPHLTRMLWFSTLLDAAIHRAWLVSMGRRSARSHMAHLLCELLLRLQVVGLAEERSFNFPLTQQEMADILGLSMVHVNRVIQELRAKALVTWRGGRVSITDWEGLVALAEFDPTYLHLETQSL